MTKGSNIQGYRRSEPLPPPDAELTRSTAEQISVFVGKVGRRIGDPDEILLALNSLRERLIELRQIAAQMPKKQLETLAFKVEKQLNATKLLLASTSPYFDDLSVFLSSTLEGISTSDPKTLEFRTRTEKDYPDATFFGDAAAQIQAQIAEKERVRQILADWLAATHAVVSLIEASKSRYHILPGLTHDDIRRSMLQANTPPTNYFATKNSFVRLFVYHEVLSQYKKVYESRPTVSHDVDRTQGGPAIRFAHSVLFELGVEEWKGHTYSCSKLIDIYRAEKRQSTGLALEERRKTGSDADARLGKKRGKSRG